MRPQQWTKNAIVGAAFIFALGDQNQEIGWSTGLLALAGIILFSLLSSSIYLLNDLIDIELDRKHPTKKYRPIPAGLVSSALAKSTSALLAMVSLGAAFLLSKGFAAVLLIYFLMQCAYVLGLKRIPWLDVFIIAMGFVLRALSGAILIEVHISQWLLLCTLLLALFLGLSKRRHEKVILADLRGESRPSLKGYHAGALDILIGLVALGTAAAYTCYTLSPSTLEKFGSHKLAYTAPFVLAGLLRYLKLVYKHEMGGRPEKVLLTDLWIILIVLGYGLSTLLVFL